MIPRGEGSIQASEYAILASVRNYWTEAVLVWEWQSAPDLFHDLVNPFGEDARRCALVPRETWECWQHDDFVPWWLENLGGVPHEQTGIANAAWWPVGKDWVVVIGGK